MNHRFSNEKPFSRQYTDEERATMKHNETFTVRLNEEEREMLDEAKQFLEQVKDSTTLKQLAMIGYKVVLHDEKTRMIVETIFKNKRKNERTGVII